MEKPKNLQSLSTHSEDIKWLGTPEHEQYQECWRKFYQRYHEPIINYILKRAQWSKEHLTDAEEIASVVYEKGFRWSFKKKKGVRFRIILKQLVKDALSDYWQKQKKEKCTFLELEQEPTVHQDAILDSLSVEILQVISCYVLSEYKGRRYHVLKWIWKHGHWPKLDELAIILEIEGEDIEKRKNAANQWRKRNRDLWEDFQDKLCHQVHKLAIGEEEQSAEMHYFENLNGF